MTLGSNQVQNIDSIPVNLRTKYFKLSNLQISNLISVGMYRNEMLHCKMNTKFITEHTQSTSIESRFTNHNK